MFRRKNTYQLVNNPLKLRQRYSHIPLQYRNINTSISQSHTNKTIFKKSEEPDNLLNGVDNSKSDNNFEDILPNSEKDDDSIEDNDNNEEDDDSNNDKNEEEDDNSNNDGN